MTPAFAPAKVTNNASEFTGTEGPRLTVIVVHTQPELPHLG
jgi:hypothetical protein